MANINNYKKSGKKITFTNGCFDILHSGHVGYLEESKSIGDVLVIGLNSDKSVRELKGKDRPINSENQRAFMLSALKCTDMVYIFEENNPLNIIKEINPDYLVKGGDYTQEAIIGSEHVKNNGGDVIIIPLEKGLSTTCIIEKIKKGR